MKHSSSAPNEHPHRVPSGREARLQALQGFLQRRPHPLLGRIQKLYTESIKHPEKFWAKQAADLTVAEEVDEGARVEAPFAKWFVGGKLNVGRQLPRPPSRRPAPQQGGHHLGRRARRQAHAHLPATAPRSLQIRQRPQAQRRQERRPRAHLHAAWFPRRPSPCSPAPASARCTPSSSAASAPKPSTTASTTAAQPSSSPPTAAGGAARSCRSSRTSTTPLAGQSPTVKQRHRLRRANHDIHIEGRPRRLVARRDGQRRSPIAPPSRSTAKHPLFILYTSGSTGKPKGILHTTAGYLLRRRTSPRK